MLLLVALGLSAPARGRTHPFLLPGEKQGSWVGADKEMHFACSLAIAATLRAAGGSDGASFGISVGTGTLKEIYDGTIRAGHPGASWRDLLADVAGAAAGFLIVDALDR